MTARTLAGSCSALVPALALRELRGVRTCAPVRDVVILSIAKDPALVPAWRVNDGSCQAPRKNRHSRALSRSRACDVVSVPRRHNNVMSAHAKPRD